MKAETEGQPAAGGDRRAVPAVGRGRCRIMTYDLKKWRDTPDWAKGMIIKELHIAEIRLITGAESPEACDVIREAIQAAREVLKETSREGASS